MKGGVLGFLTLLALGAIVGDALAHPQGTAAAGSALSNLLATSLKGASGAYAVQGK